jgi:hypothetical protein
LGPDLQKNYKRSRPNGQVLPTSKLKQSNPTQEAPARGIAPLKSSQAALDWEDHLGHIYDGSPPLIYTKAIQLSAKNISGRPVRLEDARLTSGITGATAEVLVVMTTTWHPPSDINPIPPIGILTLQVSFNPPTGLAAQEFINSWATMHLSLTYDGATHKVPIREDMTRALYVSFRPSPIGRG